MSNDKNNPSEKLKKATKIGKRAKHNSHTVENLEAVALRIFRWFSSILDRLFFDSRYTAIFALALALIMYVSVNISSISSSTTLLSSKSLSNVTVSSRYNTESFEVTGIPESCDILITGDAANVNTAATRNGYCLLNLEGYTEGTHTVNITATGYGDNVSTTVTPSQATVTLKRKTTATYEISYDFINQNSLDAKYILGTPTFSSGSKVNIRASQDTLNTISMVKALIDVTGFKEGDNPVTASLVAYDSKGNVVNADIVPNTLDATVNVSSPSKTVPINLQVTGEAPNGFALDTVTMDHQTTEIYAQQSVLDTISEVTVTLDLSTITTDANIMLPVNLPAGVSSSAVTMVNVSATLGTITTKDLLEVPIVYRNNDNNLGASEVSVTTVTLIVSGTENNIADITADDATVYINMKLDTAVDGETDENGYLLPGLHTDVPIRVEKNTDAYVTFSPDPSTLSITLVEGD